MAGSRGSVRLAIQRSNQESAPTFDYTGKTIMEPSNNTIGLQEGQTKLEAMIRKSRNATRELSSKPVVPASPNPEPQTRKRAQRSKTSIASGQSGAKVGAVRARAAGRVAKSTPTSRRRTPARKAATTQARKNPRKVSISPFPSEIPLDRPHRQLGTLFEAGMNSDRDSSPLSQHADVEFAAFTHATHVRQPLYFSMSNVATKAGVQDGQASATDTVTLTGDTETADDEFGEAAGVSALPEAVSPSTVTDEIVVAERKTDPNAEEAPSPELQPLKQLGEESPIGRAHERPRRCGAPIPRFAPRADAVSVEAYAAKPTFDPLSDGSEGCTEQKPPRKKRRTFVVATAAELPLPKTRMAPKATPSRTSRGGDAAKQTRRSFIVKLPILVSEQEIARNATENTAGNDSIWIRPMAKGMRKAILTSQTPVLPPTPESIASELVRPAMAVDRGKLSISRLLTAREPLGSKPRPQGRPMVWAESRQALCETLPYFKRPQGGCYQNDSHVYGFLFDSVGHCREYLDEDIIICRAGGSMEQDPEGGMVQKKDQSMKEAQVLAILNDIEHQNPLVVICGNRNGGAMCEMPHQYSVLGWYKPVAVWEEKTSGKGKKAWTTIKYRLERLNQGGEPTPWHAPVNSDLAIFRESCNPVYRQPCNSCGKGFDQVYLQGWMCLNSACDEFWKFGNGISAPSGNKGLDYNPDFLLSRTPTWGDERVPPAPVRPPIPDAGNTLGDDLAYINTRGICCPKCGRCNSRRLFDRWVCENSSCDYELRPQHRPVMPTHLHTPWDVAPTLVRNKVEAGVHLKIEHKYGYKICKYTFDGIDGCFIHAAATKTILGAPGGPDDIMADLQSQDLGLERRVFAVTKMSGGKKPRGAEAIQPSGAPPSPPAEQDNVPIHVEGEEPTKEKRTFEEGDLMTAFSMNYGMPYKFVASGASRSFDDSPKAVNDCRYRLNWAARTLLGKSRDELDFNEELIFTYLEGQKIEYHDDGEDGLGPEIASLSLGGRAKMHMRMKAKHFVGCSKTGMLTEEKPVPGSIDGPAMYAKRLAAWEELQELKRKSDTVAYNKRRKELPKELGIFDKRTKKADDMVTISLSHGDVMVMDGYDIQRYLEHKVVPEGYLRFALTCRTVLEDHLKPEEKPDWEVEADEGRYDGTVGY